MATSQSGTLLIVDDESSVRNSLKRLLRTEGYEIFAAENANAANHILENDAIDVILCDQDMPGKNGTDFLMEAARKYPHQRRIMISGRFQSEDVAVAMDSGAIHNFMMKPWDDAILKADIRASFRQLMSELRVGNRQEAAPVDVVSEDWSLFNEDRRLTRELHAAAGNGSLSLQYQPQVNLSTGSLCGLEALLRWNSSTGPISPDRFITLAERNGAMSKLTHWVVCEVFHQSRQWIDGWPDMQIGLNVSPLDLKDDRIIDYVEQMMRQFDAVPESIQIEVTESSALMADASIAPRLQRLADLGLGLAIDDFGAGATSLSTLADLPFTTLKLDRSLTEQLSTDKGVAVVQKILEMTRCLGMKSVVEGIETSAQAALAQSLGADWAQGYLYSRPLHRRSINEWLKGPRQALPR